MTGSNEKVEVQLSRIHDLANYTEPRYLKVEIQRGGALVVERNGDPRIKRVVVIQCRRSEEFVVIQRQNVEGIASLVK
jgi:hypothetical protein